jgi:GMP synthase-like glutamine amidotransferase
MTRRLKALIVQHEEPTPPGLLGDWLADRNAIVEVVRIDLEEHLPDARRFDLIAILGSELPAFDDSVPFIASESELIREAMNADIPMLGLCFGGQLIARALGGGSFRAERAEIGWFRLRSNDRELIPEGPWLEWHHDSFTVPPGGRLIAETDVGPQAYVVGRSLGLQFHPEVTPQIVEAWVRGEGDEPHPDSPDLDTIVEETNRRFPEMRGMTERLFNHFLRDVASIVGSR